MQNDILFTDYYADWLNVYKEGAIRKVTMNKYKITLLWLRRLIPGTKVSELTRFKYQQLINQYAEEHEKQTVLDFHRQVKAAITDAIEDGYLDTDPTRKVIIKGCLARPKKKKFLSQFELQQLLNDLDLKHGINWDWFILLTAKTGMRFSETLALTPKDFDFMKQCVSVSKTWNYKEGGGFAPTKNKSSVRKIPLDWKSCMQFADLIKDTPEDKPIFVGDTPAYNSTANDALARHCTKLNIPTLSIHGLRHTHASLLLSAGVSIASVAMRLGHSNMTTTQNTYLHIIHELENKDLGVIMGAMANLG